jgi:phage/plasmid-like protein (TIGR03299 family)
MGQVVGHTMTNAEAAREAGLADWDLQALPCYAQTEDGENLLIDRRAIYRKLDGQILGNVGSKYVIVPNEQAFEAMDGMLEDGSMQYVTAGALGKGERVWILGKIDEDFEVISGDVIAPYALFTTSHDGSGAVMGKLVHTRVVCQNTLASALGEHGISFSLRHTTTVSARLEEARERLGIVSKASKRLAAIFQKMAVSGVTTKQQERVINILAPEAKQDASDLVRERAQNDRLAIWKLLNGGSETVKLAGPDTLWGAYNAATEWIDWLEPRKGMDSGSTNKAGEPWQTRRLVYSTDGLGAARRQEVFNFLRQEVTV